MKKTLRLSGWSLATLLLLCFSLTSFSQIQQPDISLKYGKGLRITAADSSMHLKIGFRFQSLFNAERSLIDDEEWETNFLIRRSRLKFDGWVHNPNFVYKVELALSNRDLGSSSDWNQTGKAPKIILDAVAKWKFHKNFTLWAGQTKLPGNRERVVSSQKLQFVDRSLVNSIFNIDREMGVQLRSKFRIGKAVLKPMASLSLGEGRNTTVANIGGYHYVGRVELLPFGEFESKGDYFEGDLKREAKPRLAIGASLSHNVGSAKQKTTGKYLVDADGNYMTHNLNTVFVDMMFKYNGFSFMAEYANKAVTDFPPFNSDFNERAQLVDANNRSYYTGAGINAQFSYLLKNNFEIATRYTQLIPDSEVSFTGIKEYTLGLSKYVVGHNLKVQGDVSLIDKDGQSDNTLRYRLQLEVAF